MSRSDRTDDEQYLQEVADGAWGDGPGARGAARDRLLAIKNAKQLRDADIGWSGDAACVSAEVAALGADALDITQARIRDLRAEVIEECAGILDNAAQDWNRIRDPGMANNARSYARKIRALISTPTAQTPGSEP